MATHTKIICTIGPAVSSLEKILELIDAGMNGARLNFSHGTREEHLATIINLKKAREMRKVPLAIILDTKGPEIRIGEIKGGQIPIREKMQLLFVKEQVLGDERRVTVGPGEVLDILNPGMTILIDDGYLIAKVVERKREGVSVEFQNNGVLKSEKGVNIPEGRIDLPAMTKKDEEDLTFGCEQDVDMIAASFIRSSEHVLKIKHFLRERGKSDILVIAKIENAHGVENLDSIIQVADGVMVARGDLGVELPLEKIPYLQKLMIRKCYQASKLVVTATQMLESMIKVPRPTRAEVSDVANAIYDSTSVVMLSGETAIGQYPIDAVSTMKRIVVETEKDFNYRHFFFHALDADHRNISSSVASATVQTAYGTKANAIFVYTSSGFTANALSRFRPSIPIIALTSKPKVYHQLALSWGVIPVPPRAAANVREAFDAVSCFALQKGYIRYGDLVIVTAGSPFGVSGTTNMLIVESIGDVLIRGQGSGAKRVIAPVIFLFAVDMKKHYETKGKLVVLSRCEEGYEALLKEAAGIILQTHPEDADSEIQAERIAKKFNIPLLLKAENALSLLKEGEKVTLDPVRGLVFRGEIHSDEEMIPLVCSKSHQ